jgi:hypothetical protein
MTKRDKLLTTIRGLTASLNAALASARKSGVKITLQVDGLPRYDIGVYSGPPYDKPNFAGIEWATKIHVLQRRRRQGHAES